MTGRATLLALTQEHLDHFRREGYLVLPGLLTPSEITEIREHFEALHARGSIPGCFHAVPPEESGGDVLKVYPRMMHPHRVSAVAMRYMLHPRIMDVLTDLFGEEPLAAQSMYYFKPPGARGQALHQDNFYLRVKPGTCIAAWVAVDPADRENGGLVVVPGTQDQDMEIVCPEEADPALSFTKDYVPVPEGLHEQPVDLAPGDVLFFGGSLIHGSYPNTSQTRFRRSFICHYVGVSAQELARYYMPLYTRRGEPVERRVTEDGGPCGVEIKGPH
jgi:hypothetical protein